MSNRKEIELPEGIEIDASLLAEFEALPRGLNRHNWTAQEDYLLLTFWPEKAKETVSKKLDLPVDACRKRYKQLTEAK